MSAEHAKKFVGLVDSDPQLQEAVKNNQGNLAELAAQRGFDFTQEELHDELRARWGMGDPGSDPGGQCNTNTPQCNTAGPDQCNTNAPQCNTAGPDQCNTTAPQCNTTGPDRCNTADPDQCNTTDQCNTADPAQCNTAPDQGSDPNNAGSNLAG